MGYGAQDVGGRLLVLCSHLQLLARHPSCLDKLKHVTVLPIYLIDDNGQMQ